MKYGHGITINSDSEQKLGSKDDYGYGVVGPNNADAGPPTGGGGGKGNDVACMCLPCSTACVCQGSSTAKSVRGLRKLGNN